MGCMCCSLSSFLSVVLNAFERATICTVCAVLTFCLLFTILAVLAIGVGIGFHYCFVTQTIDVMAKAAKNTAQGTQGNRRSLPEMRRSNSLVRAVEHGLDRGAGANMVRHLTRREVGSLAPLSNNQTANLTAVSVEGELLLRNMSKCVNC